MSIHTATSFKTQTFSSGKITRENTLLVKIALMFLPMLLAACESDNSVATAQEPVKPAEYQATNTATIERLVANYNFEGSLADASGISPNATPVGHTTEFANLGNIQFDRTDGIHALSESAVFDGISGLLLPGNIISYPSFSLSMWVKPAAGNTGPLFFAKSANTTLVLDQTGLTVSGATGQGTNNDETITYGGDNYSIPAATWSHIAFTVSQGLVNIYINGERVYKAGDLLDDKTTFADGFQMQRDGFDNVFSQGINTVALGVSDSETLAPYTGKIDNLRIYDYALYYGNVTVLSREVTKEGPTAAVSATLASPGVQLNWTIERFNPSGLSLSREGFGSKQTTLLHQGENLLPGSDSDYLDTAMPLGDSYRYTLTAIDADDHVYTTKPTDYVRVPGSQPYAAINATLNEQSEHIELNLYTENLNIASYDILRDTDNQIGDATVIAAGITATTYTDAKDDDFPLADGTPYYYWVQVTDATTAEVTTSQALPSANATAAGEFIAPGSFILQEDAEGFCGLDGVLEALNLGFTGAGYINTDNEVGKASRWRINVSETATYILYVRYANGAADNRFGILTANTAELINPLDLIATGAWTTYTEVKHVIELEAGIVDLALTAQTEGGLANVDYLRFEAPDGVDSPIGVACAE